MVECNSHEAHSIYPNLSATLLNEQQFRLNKINEIRDYFVAEIKERELINKNLGNILLLLTICNTYTYHHLYEW